MKRENNSQVFILLKLIANFTVDFSKKDQDVEKITGLVLVFQLHSLKPDQ